MNALIRKIQKSLYDHNVPLENRIGNLFICMGVLAALLGTLICIFCNVNAGGIITVVMIFLLALTITLTVFKLKKQELGKIIMVAGVIVAMPILWITSGGINSGVNIWFVFELFFFALALTGKKLIFALIFAAILDGSCYVISYIKPEWIFTFDSQINVYISTVGSVIVVSLSVILTMIVQKKIYNDENHKLEESYQIQKELKIEAENSNKAKGDFLANMSHEIRTPINAILGMDEMILRGGTPKEIEDYANNIKKSGNTLLALINDILDFSKIENGKMDIIPVEYDLSSVLNDLLVMISPRVKSKGLNLHTRVDSDTPSKLYGDDVRLRQIITNLLTNAVKYTDSGRVTLAVSGKKIDDENVLLYVSVTDTGIGVKEEDQKKMFEAFQRVDESRNRHIEGTGLGLSITVSLLNLMGSELKLNSVYGLGSDFYFELKQKIVDATPIGDFDENFAQRREKESVYRESFTAPKAKILVVDDNEMNLMVVKGLMKNTGMQITTAKSGMECLEYAKKETYHIIFLDHMMPVMDGIETLQHLREMDSNLMEAKVIALTANAVAGAREMFLEKGFDDFLSKPVKGEKLEKMILKYLPENLVEYNDDYEQEVIDREEVIAKAVADAEEQEALKNSDNSEYSNTETILWVKGRELCGGEEEIYREILQELVNSDMNGKLESLYASQDWANYYIQMHAVKSNLMNVGAEALANMAKDLEYASKDWDVDFINENHEKFITGYKNVISNIQKYLKK